MCGIYGIHNYAKSQSINRSIAGEMGELLSHRGPDDSGSYFDSNIALGIKRLAIVDLVTGHQPILNETGKIALVLNGEIYNYKELTNELTCRGHKFKTKTDSETIVHLYEDYGLDCLDYLRGMFAFALWDSEKKRLFIARDRLGKKPLYYTAKNGQIAFASELHPLVKTTTAKEINLSAINYFLTLQYIPSPHTIYKNIFNLPPAHFLIAENGNIETKRYWDLKFEKNNLTSEETKEQIKTRLTESVKLRLDADVSVGSFLSGGIDSSIVTLVASGLSDKPLKTFSAGFEEEDFSELEYARKIAGFCGCDHSEFIVKPDAADILPELIRHYGQPFADPSALPFFYLSRETSRHIKTVLTGDGGDENFAGYLRYPAMKLAKFYMFLPRFMRITLMKTLSGLPDKDAPYDFNWRLKRFLSSASLGSIEAVHLNMSSFFNDAEKEMLYSRKMKRELKHYNVLNYIKNIFAKSDDADFINKLLYTDIKSYLPECLLVKTDIASMANSLEVRSPFLDHKFMEFIFGLKDGLKLKRFTTKWILRETFREALPPGFLNRPKMGFGIPLGRWFRTKLKNVWQDNCLSDTALARGYFNPAAVKTLWNRHQSGKLDNGYKLWALLVLEIWHRTFEFDFRL